MSFCDIEIETFLGATYRLPDVGLDEAQRFVRSFPDALRQEQVALVNGSGACLTLPTRVIKRVWMVKNPRSMNTTLNLSWGRS